MTHSHEYFEVLHALRVKGFASTDALVECAGPSRERLASRLEAAEKLGLVEFRTGRIEGWRLTSDGREAHARMLEKEMADVAEGRELLLTTYEEFSRINSEFKLVCTNWQLRDATTINDHTDADYDAAVVGRLSQVHEKVIPICSRVSAVVDRFARYAPRFDEAIDRLRNGDPDAFTKPLTRSYHDVWMELHEDLIVSLCLQRTAADA